MEEISVLSIQTGRIVPLGPKGVPSAFVKSGVEGPIGVEMLGLAGDEQADPSVHGGPEKAVYAYAADHYLGWAADFPELGKQFVAGSMGENLTIGGMDEADICVGDTHAIGNARLQVCQPRQPCFKLALRFANDRLPFAMIRSGRSGWYYRVLEPGVISAGDKVNLVDRPNPDFSFDRLVAIVYHRSATHEETLRLAAMPEVASQIRRQAQHSITRIHQGAIR